MSKRSTHCGAITKTDFSVLVFLLTLLVTGLTTVQAQWGNPTVIIDGKGNVPLGSLVDVGVNLMEDSVDQHSFSGFDLLITYDPQALTFIGAFKGGLLDSCEWESFQYQQGQLIPGKQAVRLTAVADLDNGAHHPSSFLGGKTGQLASLRFQFTSDSAYMWYNVTQIDCYWNDCSDNTFLSLVLRDKTSH